jgi:hypothetical protein
LDFPATAVPNFEKKDFLVLAKPEANFSLSVLEKNDLNFPIKRMHKKSYPKSSFLFFI